MVRGGVDRQGYESLHAPAHPRSEACAHVGVQRAQGRRQKSSPTFPAGGVRGAQVSFRHVLAPQIHLWQAHRWGAGFMLANNILPPRRAVRRCDRLFPELGGATAGGSYVPSGATGARGRRPRWRLHRGRLGGAGGLTQLFLNRPAGQPYACALPPGPVQQLRPVEPHQEDFPQPKYNQANSGRPKTGSTAVGCRTPGLGWAQRVPICPKLFIPTSEVLRSMLHPILRSTCGVFGISKKISFGLVPTVSGTNILCM